MAGLLWNGTALNTPWATSSPYWLEVGRRNLSWGSPEAVKAIALSLLRDGDFSRVDRYGNRVIEFEVAVNAYHFDALAAGEKVLTQLATQGRGVLSWTPRGPGGAPETVWDVLTGSLELVEDTLGEDAELRTKASYRRVYRVTLECLPFARSANIVSQPATSVLTGQMTVPVAGSVRTEGAVRITRASGSLPYNDLHVYFDPAMVSTTFNPNDSATWAAAPSGDYVLWGQIGTAGAASVPGDVWTATATAPSGATQTVRTRYSGAPATWNVLGPMRFDGRKDGTVGAQTFTFTRNGVAEAAPALRLYRVAPETALTVLPTVSGTVTEIAAPSLDHPNGGIWQDGDDSADVPVSWEHPVFTPGETGMVILRGGAGADSVVVEYYPRWHTYAGRVT